MASLNLFSICLWAMGILHKNIINFDSLQDRQKWRSTMIKIMNADLPEPTRGLNVRSTRAE